MKISLFNAGSAVATGVNGTVSETGTTYLGFSNVISTYPDITSYNFEENVADIDFTVSAVYVAGTPINILFDVTNEYFKSWSFNFDLELPNPINCATLHSVSDVDNITLYWDQVAGVSGYNVYKYSTISGLYEKQNNYPITYPFYADSELDITETYTYKVSTVSAQGVEGTATCEHVAWTTLPASDSWPRTTYYATTVESSPNVIDVDGDGNKEIFFTARDGNVGYLYAFHSTGEEMFDTDDNTTTVSEFATVDSRVASIPAIGDIDNDGIFEVVFTSRIEGSEEKRLFVYETEDGIPDTNDQPDFEWSCTTNARGYRGVVLSDLDMNGSMEIILKGEWGSNMQVYNSDGTNYNGWPLNTSPSAGLGMPAVADIDNDGFNEIVIGFARGEWPIGNYSDPGIYVFNHDGTDLIDVSGSIDPICQVDNNEDGIMDNMDAPPIIADIDNNGVYDIIAVSAVNGVAYVYAIKTDALNSFVSGWSNAPVENVHTVNLYEPSWISVPAVGDLNLDGNVEVIIAGYEQVIIWDNEGNLVSQIEIPEFNPALNVPIIADIDADLSVFPEGDNEVIVVSDNRIYAFKMDGSPVPGWPLVTNGSVTTPAVSDIDNDGLNELVATSSGVKVYVWDTQGDAALIEWGVFRHDSYNTGCYKAFDLYMKDGVTDYGIEPNPNGITPFWDIWASPDLWANTSTSDINDAPLTPGIDHYVHVNIRNIGNQPFTSTDQATLHLYWTVGRTEETWDDDWLSIGSNHNDFPYWLGGEIPISNPNVTLDIGEVKHYYSDAWVPNSTAELVDGSWQEHYYGEGTDLMLCFLARVECPVDDITGETSDIGYNVSNFNNIVTRNSRIVESTGGDIIPGGGTFIVNNALENVSTVAFNIQVTNDDNEDSYDQWGSVILSVGHDLFQAWVDGVSQGEYIRPNSAGNSFTITGRDAWMGGISLDPDEKHLVNLRFWPDNTANPLEDYHYNYLLHNIARGRIIQPGALTLM